MAPQALLTEFRLNANRPRVAANELYMFNGIEDAMRQDSGWTTRVAMEALLVMPPTMQSSDLERATGDTLTDLHTRIRPRDYATQFAATSSSSLAHARKVDAKA